MENEINWGDEPPFWAVVPVLASNNVIKTACYYHEVLGFSIDDIFFWPRLDPALGRSKSTLLVVEFFAG